MVSWDSKVLNSASCLLLLIIISSCLAEIRWSVFISKFNRSLYVSFSRTDSGLCIYYLFVRSNLNFLHNSQWITLPTQSCLVSLCVFFTPSLTGGFSLEFEWQQGFQNSSQHSCQLQQCCGLDSLDSSSDLQFPQFLFSALEDHSKSFSSK